MCDNLASVDQQNSSCQHTVQTRCTSYTVTENCIIIRANAAHKRRIWKIKSLVNKQQNWLQFATFHKYKVKWNLMVLNNVSIRPCFNKEIRYFYGEPDKPFVNTLMHLPTTHTSLYLFNCSQCNILFIQKKDTICLFVVI